MRPIATGDTIITASHPDLIPINASSKEVSVALGSISLSGIDAIVYSYVMTDRKPLDPFKDVIPVGRLTRDHWVLTSTPELKVNSVSDLIALGKSQAGGLTYASIGTGSTVHMLGERFRQLAGIEAVGAGVTGGDADAAARSVIEDAGLGERFGHSLGHGVGLEIHEGPTLRKGSEDVLPEGAVVTVEPGVYLPGVGGVGLEDMVVVEGDGCRPLPASPKELLVL